MYKSPSSKSNLGRTLKPKQKEALDLYLILKYGSICQWCFKPIDRSITAIDDPMRWSRDHIIARRDGGTNDKENIQPMHAICNKLKDSASMKKE